MINSSSSLLDKVIAVPESRQEDILAQLLESRGAKVLRVPMVSIHDNPDSESVLAWIKEFIASPPILMIILTGEGVRRLLALAETHSVKGAFIAALGKVDLLCRGPKPNRALREVGLSSNIQANAPTTDGVIETLAGMSFAKQQIIAVQLYGEEPNQKLMDYLSGRELQAHTVAPYIYAAKAEESKVVELIRALESGEVDVIAFTSMPQLKRLQKVALAKKMTAELESGLIRTKLAAVGPMVKEQLEEAGFHVDIMPERAFFMKPLVTAIMKYFED